MPYGEMLMENTNMDYDNPYKYNAKEFDVSTGYYYYGARYYDPKRSFWLSVDPLEEITNSPYAYVWNDPVNFADPTGMMGERVGGSKDGPKTIKDCFGSNEYDYFDTRNSNPPHRWGNNHQVKITWENNFKISGTGGQEGTYTYVQTGRLYANNGIDFLKVERVKYYYDMVGYDVSSRKLDVDMNPNVEYHNKNIDWATTSRDSDISKITNCYGYALADGLYYINESTNNIINYLMGDGYKNIGKPSLSMKYNIGDLILFDGHIIEAVNVNGSLQWESYWAGDNEAKYGSLKNVLSEITIGGSSTKLGNAIGVYRPNKNDMYLIKKKYISGKKIINEANRDKSYKIK